MHTITSVVNAITGTDNVLKELKAILRNIDPEYPAEEKRFNAACRLLLKEVGNTVFPSAAEYLQAQDDALAASLLYIAGQGFKLNADIFNNPANALFLQRFEFEDLNRERILASLPAVQQSEATRTAFYNAIQNTLLMQSDSINTAIEDISEMYAYLQTSGYKLAHYYGFIFADHFLPNVMPGYHSDDINTGCYNRALQNYLNVDLSKLEGTW